MARKSEGWGAPNATSPNETSIRFAAHSSDLPSPQGGLNPGTRIRRLVNCSRDRTAPLVVRVPMLGHPGNLRRIVARRERTRLRMSGDAGDALKG